MKLFLIPILAMLIVFSSVDAQESLSPETLKAIKAATVFIKVPVGNKQATGTGWIMSVIDDTALLITNHHVIADAPNGSIYPEVSVVFFSGTKDEHSATAVVLASQKELDLAVLRVVGVRKGIKPITIGPAQELFETQPVVVFGFPFTGLDGAKNPPITVTRGAVSSIRDDGIVQLDTNLNPGNSGGPVVDTKGQLIAIAFARPKGENDAITGIGLAIPPESLLRLLSERITDSAILSKKVVDGRSEIEFEAILHDPLEKIKTITLTYVQTDKAPHDLSEMPTAKKIEVPVRDQRAVAKFVIEAKEPGLYSYFCQASAADGVALKTAGKMLPFHVNYVKNMSSAQGELIVLDQNISYGNILAIALSPDGKTLATAGGGTEIHLLDIKNGWKSSVLNEHKNTVQSVAFSPDGKWLASCDTAHEVDVTLIRETATNKVVHRIESTTSRFYPLTFSHDSQLLAACRTDNEVSTFDVATGKELEAFKVPRAGFYLFPMMSLAFSPSGRMLATGSRDGFVRLWEVANRTQVAEFAFDGDGVYSVAWSPDGKIVAAGNHHGIIKWWDVESRTERATLKGHEGPVFSLAFTSDGTMMASGSWDGTIRLWHVVSNTEIVKLTTKRDNRFNSLTFSPDDQLLIATQGTAGQIVVFDVQQALTQKTK